MMKAITTKYLSATTYRPRRVTAFDATGNRITISDPDCDKNEDSHRAAAVALCEKMEWAGADTLIPGAVKGAVVWVFAASGERNRK